MKTPLIPNRNAPIAIALTVALALTMAVQAVAELVRYEGQPSVSKCKMAGTSTMHDWTMESGMVLGSMEVDPNFPESALTNADAAT